jgi:cadherin
MEGKSLSKKAIIAIVIIAILVIAAISMVVVFLRDQGETEATAIGENSSNSEQTQDAVPDNNGDNNQGTATQSEEPQQEEQTTVADNDGATTTNVGTTTPATTTTAPAQQTTTTTDGSTQVATTTTTETIPTQALTLAWSNMTVSGGELLANIDANVTDVTAPIVRTLYILNVSDENRRQYIRDGETLKVEVNFNEILAQNPTLTIGTGENTQTVEFGFYPIENWPYRYVANIKVDNTILGLADGTQIPFTITNIVDRDNTLTLDNDDVTYTAEYGQVTYENTAPQIIIKGTPGYEEEGKNYIGSLEENTFSYISFKFFDTTMLKGKYEVNDTLITGKKADKEGEADFSEFDEYLVQGENTIRTWDMAGNMAEYTFTYDSIAPVYSKLGILNKTRYVNKVEDLTWAKEGDEVRILISFPELLSVEPTVKVFGKEYTATYRPLSSNPEQNIYYYMVDFTLDETMPEGEIPFKVYGYADIAGNVGEKLDQTRINRDEYPRVIYDRTAPYSGKDDAGHPLYILNVSDENRRTWIRNGETLRVEANFNEDMDMSRTPILTIGTGKNTQTAAFEYKDTVDGKRTFVADIVIDNDILGLTDGTQVPFTVTNAFDLAGNEAILDNEDVTFTSEYGQVTYDNNAPVVKTVGMLNDTHYNEGKDTTVATTGDRIRLRVAFEEKLAVEPTVEVIGEDGTVTEVSCTYREQTSKPENNYYMYMADFTLTEEMNLPEGPIQVRISGYADAAGNVGEVVTEINEEAYPGVVYDTVAPKLSAMGIFNWTNDNYGGDITLATRDEHIRLYVTFTEMLGVNPKVDIYGENGKVTTMDLAWSEAAQFYFVEFDTTEELQLPQGKIQYRIYGYEDAAGNVGDDITQEQTTSKEYPYVIYDTVAPEYTALGIVNGSHYDAKEGDIYHAKTGDYVRILVQFDNEKLAVMPKIRILGADNKVVKEVNMIDAYLTSESMNTNAYSGQFTITEDMNLPEGEIKFEVYGYEDAAGNVGTTLTNTDLKYPGIDQGVEYDKTNPTPYFVEFTTTNANNNRYAKVGDQVWVKVGIKEELSKYPVIKINGITTNTIINDPAGVIYVGWITMTEDMTEGKMSFEISGYEDLAGNVGDTITTTTNDTSVTFDKTAPALRELRVQNFYNPTGNQNYSGLTQNPRQNKGIAITVNTTELLDKNPIIVIGGKEIEVPVKEPQFNKYVVYVDITEDMNLVEGEKIPVTVKGLVDLAGNTGTEVTSTGNDNYYVIFDKTAPKASKLGITNITHYYEEGEDIAIAGTGDEIRVLAFFDDEKLTVEPKLRILDANGNVIKDDIKCGYSDLTSSHMKTNAYLANFHITEDMNLPEGEINFELYGYMDIAGNTGDTLTNKQINYDPYWKVVYDKTAPVKTNLGIARNKDEGDTRDQKYAKAGDSIRVLVSFPEKLAVEPKVEMFGNVYDVTYRPDSSNEAANVYYYMADVKIDENTPEGDVTFRVYGYKDAAGNEGTPLTNDNINDGTYTNVVIDTSKPTIEPTEDSVSGSEGNYSRIGFKVTDNNGVASYEINGETLILTKGEISYEVLKSRLKEGANTVVASDEAGNTAEYTFNYDAVAPTREYSNIMVNGDNSKEHEFYAKIGDKLWVSIGVKEKLAHNPLFTLINNGVEYPMDGDLVKANYDEKNDRYSYVLIYEIPEDTAFVDGEITFKISDLVDLFGNKMTDETKPSNGNRVFFDKTNPIIKVNDNAEGNAPYFRNNIGFTISDNLGIDSCELNGKEIECNNGQISFESIKDKLNENETKNTLVVKDLSGNEASYEFWYDYKAPKANFVQIRSNKKVNKDYAQPGDEVWVYVKIKEELSVLPTIEINGQKVDTFKNGQPNENGQMYAGKLKMTKDMENGDVSFKIFGYADKAGNVGETIENKTTDNSNVIFDKDAPTVNLVHIQNITRGGSEAKVGDIIWVYVNVTEKEADLSNAPEITINGKKARVFVNEPSVPSNTSTKYVGEIEVTEDMDIGEMTFEISAYTDRAGNVGNVLTSTTDGSSMTIVKD